MNIKNEKQQYHKNLAGGSPKQNYITFHLILISTFNKVMASVEGVLNDIVDIPEESIEQHKKRE